MFDLCTYSEVPEGQFYASVGGAYTPRRHTPQLLSVSHTHRSCLCACTHTHTHTHTHPSCSHSPGTRTHTHPPQLLSLSWRAHTCTHTHTYTHTHTHTHFPTQSVSISFWSFEFPVFFKAIAPPHPAHDKVLQLPYAFGFINQHLPHNLSLQ